MNLDEQLTFKFFAMFSRMEYALKRAGFVQAGKHDSAHPAWDRFVASIEPRWTELRGSDFLRARDYLLSDPPRQQIVLDGVLDWRDTGRTTGESEASFIVRCVRRVRNNLFHGGKFPTGPVRAPERDAELLRHGLAILDSLLGLDERVKEVWTPED